MAADTQGTRFDRRKARTRAALIDAARTFIADQGRTDVSIQEITEAADVGFGSFYNHFKDKAELFEAAVETTLAEHAALVDELLAGYDDPAEVFATSVRLTGRLQRAHPATVRILLHSGTSYLLSEHGIAPSVLRDLRAAAADGQFDIDDPELALATVGGAMLGLLQLLEARPEMDAGKAADRLALDLLRMFGLTRKAAEKIVSRPLPELSVS
ncbi:TetR/AcrR family transcriptional regulator [Streptomyces lydicus]|uniref:TetR/AcrR family transcriptional regulator n=1 Tax=Streptomyces lydicus TaxID=47763 RepID=UPI002E321EDF|nr:TetR/AcrR family transcriptional regulator [Streptomyces lydicus]